MINDLRDFVFQDISYNKCIAFWDQSGKLVDKQQFMMQILV